MTAAQALPDRFWVKVNKTETCWEWTGAGTPEGYGKYNIGGRRMRGAHRVAYQALVGPIPDGLELDHLCRNPCCVNPAHLEPVTRAENARRGASGVLVTHCAQGHEYNAANTGFRGSGHRYCKECNRERHRARAAARRTSPEKHAAFRRQRNEYMREHRTKQGRHRSDVVDTEPMSSEGAFEYVEARLADAVDALVGA